MGQSGTRFGRGLQRAILARERKMERFSWRPALLARRSEVGVSAEGLVAGAGRLWRWADLEEVGWSLDVIGATVVVGLRLRWGRQERVLGYRGQGPVPAECARMLRAVLGAIARARPELAVVIGHGGAARRRIFAVGVALVLAGQAAVVLGLWGLVTRGWGEALGPGIAGSVVTAMGLGVALANRPGIALPEVGIGAFVAGFDLPENMPDAR
jgi:hypothetical protein